MEKLGLFFETQNTEKIISCVLVAAAALSVGAASALPDILGHVELGRNYEPFSSQFTSSISFDETTFYAPAAKYAMDRWSIPYETEIYEYRDVTNVKYALPSVINGFMGYVLGDLRTAWGFIHFLFPVFSFLLAYYIAKRFTNHRLAACAIALVFCIIGFGPRNLINVESSNSAAPIFISRVGAPAVTLPFLLMGLIGLIDIESGRYKRGIILSGIFGGLLFYTFYFYQVAFIVSLIALFAIYLIRRQKEKYKSIFAAGILANIIAVPWYFQYLKARMASPEYFSRWFPSLYQPPLLEIAAVLMLLGIFFACYRLLRTKMGSVLWNYLPLITLISSSLALQYVLAPVAPILLQPSQFLQHITLGFSTLTLGIAFVHLWNGRSRTFNILLAAIAIGTVVMVFFKQSTVWENTKKYVTAVKAEQDAETLIRENTADADVVAFQNSYLNNVFSARLARYRFYGYVGLSNVTGGENLERYLFVEKLFNQPWEKMEQELRGDPDTILPPLKVLTVPSLITYRVTIPQTEIEKIKTFYETADGTFLSGKKLDYAVTLNQEEENDLRAGAERLHVKISRRAENHGVSLYQLR